jgi:hypothetical protein
MDKIVVEYYPLQKKINIYQHHDETDEYIKAQISGEMSSLKEKNDATLEFAMS